jgi:hypothetical protein
MYLTNAERNSEKDNLSNSDRTPNSCNVLHKLAASKISYTARFI